MTSQVDAASVTEGGSYELIRARLGEQAKRLAEATQKLNASRQQKFGQTELTVIGSARLRTEHNCVPRDMTSLGGRLLFGYNVFLGLKTERAVEDVFSLYQLEDQGGVYEFAPLKAHAPLAQGIEDRVAQNAELAKAALVGEQREGLFESPAFRRDFAELHQYYKDARLRGFVKSESKLLAVFQIGQTFADVRVFRWAIDQEPPRYLDQRGERDYVLPPAHDFAWVQTTRGEHVSGRHPHVNVLDEVFVETVGGDLTVKIENNTEDGLGIYREPVDDAHQSLDDAQIEYAQIGTLILLRILPYREERFRYLVFNTRTKAVSRIDAIGEACLQLPENHGLIFPGGYYLQSGETKVFDGDHRGLLFQKQIRAPNGEDVLYCFSHPVDGRHFLLAYNLIRKEVAPPIQAHGFTLFPDGKLVLFRGDNPEPAKIFPVQIWQTPFVSLEHAAEAPRDGSLLSRIGNPELVRGISDCLSIARAAEHAAPARESYEDLISFSTRTLDQYHWLGQAEAESLAPILDELRRTAEKVVDEFEKVVAIRTRSEAALTEAKRAQAALAGELRLESYSRIEEFMAALVALRKQRGQVVRLRELRFIDLAAVEALEAELTALDTRTSEHAVQFLLAPGALEPVERSIGEIGARIERLHKSSELAQVAAELEALAEGLRTVSEVVAGLDVEDPEQRTGLLENVSRVFALQNQLRGALEAKRKTVLGEEGRVAFAVELKLLAQATASALTEVNSPEACDDQLGRILIQLEALEARFAEFELFAADLAERREEVLDAFGSKKQALLDERQRRSSNLLDATQRILGTIERRARSFQREEDLHAFYAADAMVLRLRKTVEQLVALGDGLRAEEVLGKLKSSEQTALRNLRDRAELFEGDANLLKLGQHRFYVHSEPFELTILPRGETLCFHLTGTDYFRPLRETRLEAFARYHAQEWVSENTAVYRSEYLAAVFLEGRRTLPPDEESLLAELHTFAAARYDEGYERGIHDLDAAKIARALFDLRSRSGLLRFAPEPRALALIFYAYVKDRSRLERLHLQAQSLGRLERSFGAGQGLVELGRSLGAWVGEFCREARLEATGHQIAEAGAYLAGELTESTVRFQVSSEASALWERARSRLQDGGLRSAFERDLEALAGEPAEALALSRAWIDALSVAPEEAPYRVEAALLFAVPRSKVARALHEGGGTGRVVLSGLVGQHPRVVEQQLELRLDEFEARLGQFRSEVVPEFRRFRELRHELLEAERTRLRLHELRPRVLSSFVRNRLIDEVYLPLIGDNLAKQVGASGKKKRTDQMGLLLLISPPGYGKTTLMEYLASRLGMVFMKINGPALGHRVVSLDPAEAPNATARKEVEKINLGLEMGSNVMLYLDDIQHTSPELLEKFISLCDGQRRIEGVFEGETKTYDFKGKRFCVVMAGNPYTESGERFRVPDMLANRADTYNLGDVLNGRDDLFELSYLENCLTSSPALLPLAGRGADLRVFLRIKSGESVAPSEFSHDYSENEREEIVQVLHHLAVIQRLLLRVNAEYIASAGQDDRYRNEPPFKLQGSYRNMNKLAEKVVAVMNEAELERLITDHYTGEAQTLTTGAEQNLLKLSELRGRLEGEAAERWAAIKSDFRRIRLQGGAADDPVTRISGTLAGLAQNLEGIQREIEKARERTPDPALRAAIEQQVAQLEEVLVPFVRGTSKQLEWMRTLTPSLLELLELLKLRALDSPLTTIRPVSRNQGGSSGAG